VISTRFFFPSIWMDQICGGTPYGATTLAGAGGSRQPTENELEVPGFQGRHVAEIAAKLRCGDECRLHAHQRLRYLELPIVSLLALAYEYRLHARSRIEWACTA
jgi:hypothetical protein